MTLPTDPLSATSNGLLLKERGRNAFKLAVRLEQGDQIDPKRLAEYLRELGRYLEFAGQQIGDLGWALHDEKQNKTTITKDRCHAALQG